MKNAKKFGIFAIGVILVLAVVSFIPATIRAKIPGLSFISNGSQGAA